MENCTDPVGNTSNASGSTGCPFSPPSQVENIVVGIIFSIVIVIGLLGNSSIMYMIARDAMLRRSVITHYIFNLAVADMTMMVLGGPEVAFKLTNVGWPLGNEACKVWRFVIVTANYSSVVTLVAICIERYIAIVHPIQANRLHSHKKVYSALATIWLLCMGAAAPVLWYNRVVTAGNSTRCKMMMSKWGRTGYDLSQFGLFFLIPLLVQMVLYSIIIQKLCESTRRLSQHTYRGGRRESTASEAASGFITRTNGGTNGHRFDGRGRSVYSVVSATGETHGIVRKLNSESSMAVQESHAGTCEVVTRSGVPLRPRNHYNHHRRNTMDTASISNGGNPQTDTMQARYGVVRMLVACVVCHFLTYFPSQLYTFMKLAGLCVTLDMTIVGIMLTYINSAVNPIFYFVFSRTFRDKFKDMYRCWGKTAQTRRHGNMPHSQSNATMVYTGLTGSSSGEVLRLTSLSSSPDTPLVSPTSPMTLYELSPPPMLVCDSPQGNDLEDEPTENKFSYNS